MEGYLEKVFGGRNESSIVERVRLATSIISARHSSVRFFQLKSDGDAGPLLHYFKTESDCTLGRVRGTVDCRGCRVTMGSDARTFIVYTRGRDITLRAECRNDARRWADAITRSGRDGINMLEPMFATPSTPALTPPTLPTLAPPPPRLSRQAAAPAEDLFMLPQDDSCSGTTRSTLAWTRAWLLLPVTGVATVLTYTTDTTGCAFRCGLLALLAVARACGFAAPSGERLVQALFGAPAPPPPPRDTDNVCVVCMDAEPSHAMVRPFVT